MKRLPVALLLLASSLAAAQTNSALAAAKAACGPGNETFSVKEMKDHSAGASSAPVAGKAQVYIVEVQDMIGPSFKSDITTKVGVDGLWVGATQGNSFLAMAVDPGEHHLCTNWQSKLGSRSKLTALAGFTAAAGQTYYFRLKTYLGAAQTPPYFSLDPVNADEGKLLLASSAAVQWKKN